MKNKYDDITEAEFSFLRGFYPEGRDLTIKTLQNRTGYSYERAHSYLNSLFDKSAVMKKIVGRTLVYSLNFNKMSSKIAYWIYSTKKANEFSNKKADVFIGLSELPEEELDLYVIFGSYAKSTERKESDIDLLCVTSNKEKIETAIASIKRRYGLDIQAVIMPKTEFAKIKRENSEFWNDLVKYGIIFKGYELFYYHAYGEQNKKE